MARRLIKLPGEYLSWADHVTSPIQEVAGTVAECDLDGATTYNGEPCPLMLIGLGKGVDSYRDKGRTLDHHYEAGDMIKLSCGPKLLKAAILEAKPLPGWSIWIRLVEVRKTQSGGSLKIFEVEIDHDELPFDEAEDDRVPPF